MSAAVLRRPRASAPPASRDDELDNGEPEFSGEEDEDEMDELDDDPIEDEEDDDDNNTPVSRRTRSRSISPHIPRTTTTTTTKQQTITFPKQSTLLSPSVTSIATAPPPQHIQPTYQPPAPSSSSVVFPLVTKRRLRFWIPLLVSLLLTALLLSLRSPRALHSSPTRWSQSHHKQSSGEELTAQVRSADSRQRREAVHNPSSGRTEYDQYASHQDDKEEMAKENARRIIDEIHGRAAQIKQQQQPGTDDRTQPHYEPLNKAHPSAKDIERERKQRGELDDSSWVLRAADWLGIGPYLRQEKREDGVHHMRGDDDDGTDKFDYARSAGVAKGGASVDGKQAGESQSAVGEGNETEDESHLRVNSMLTHLKQLEERFYRNVESIQHRITSKQVPPYQQIRADDTNKQESSTSTSAPTTATKATDSADDSVPVKFISTSPDHPLLDSLHSILASVESLIARPVPASSKPVVAASYWSRLMDGVFPSSVSDEARKVYDIARHEASKEAARVRSAMSGEYDKLRSQLRAIGEQVKEGTAQPLELYEQYNPEKVKHISHTRSSRCPTGVSSALHTYCLPHAVSLSLSRWTRRWQTRYTQCRWRR